MNELLSDSQSGFRAGHSTQDVLLHVTEKWRQDIDEGRYVGAGFLDLKKAFDCVNHKILLEKALYYGIRGIEMKWLTSYLSERSQLVCLNGNLSESGDVTIGVPQGSILGPLLFVLYTNDMPRAILHSCINMYADDTEIHYANKELSMVEKRLQEDLYALESWMSSNRLKFNVKKSCIMLVGTRQKLKDKSISVFLSGLQLEQVMHIKYLGLIIDSHLKWDEHINYVLKRVRNKLDSIGRLKPLPPRLLSFLYLVYVLPIFDYCDIVWSPSTINKAMQLERLHHKVTRNLPTIKQRGFSLHHSLAARRKYHTMVAAFKIVKHTAPVYLHDLLKFTIDVTQRVGRNVYRLYIHSVRTNYGKNSFYFRAAMMWNNLNTKLYTVSSLHIFKHLYATIYC